MKTHRTNAAWRGWFLFGLILMLSCLALQTSAQEVLLVYGAGKLKGGDDKLADHLLKKGYTLTLLSDQQVTVEDSRGKDLVIISDSVDSTLLGAMFREAKVPILCAEHQQLDDLGLTDLSYGTDFGKSSRRLAVKIVDSGNTLAAGLRGNVRVSTDPCTMGWGVPGPNAVRVGLLGGSDAASQKYALFEYEVGGQMPGLVAPAKRVGLLLSTSAFAHLTADGQKLLDSAVDHAVRASAGGCAPCQSGEHQITFKNTSTETIWVGIWSGPANTGFDSTDPDMPNWQLEPNKSGKWCAPHGFNGGIFPRTKCLADDGTTWKECESGDCGGNTCTTGHQPASFCEFNFDDENKKTWYDVSYVDAYTFPMQVTVDNYSGNPNHDQNWCWTAGCTSLPVCPWDTRGDKICYGGCREWELRHADKFPWWPEIQQHLAVCCKCTDNQAVPSCTCGDPCCNGGCGCTPNGTIPDSGKNQVCKDPFTMDGSTQCDWNKNGSGPSLDPKLDYTAYAKGINGVCADSYTWTFHDKSGDMNCKNDDNSSLNFTVTFGPR